MLAEGTYSLLQAYFANTLLTPGVPPQPISAAKSILLNSLSSLSGLLACVVVGGLLMAIAWLGWAGYWHKFLFISLEPLQTSLEWVIGLTVAGFLIWLFGGILLRVRT
jgi:hypothetical protein